MEAVWIAVLAVAAQGAPDVRLALEGIRPSIGTVGDAYGNALMETVNGLYKTECIRTMIFHDGTYKTIADVEHATAGWTDGYKPPPDPLQHRRHYPAAHEATHYEALTRGSQPA